MPRLPGLVSVTVHANRKSILPFSSPPILLCFILLRSSVLTSSRSQQSDAFSALASPLRLKRPSSSPLRNHHDASPSSRSFLSSLSTFDDRRQRRRFEAPEPDLNRVIFHIPQGPDTQGDPRKGSMSAFLSDAARESLCPTKHSQFSFQKFQEYTTGVTKFPSSMKWIARLPKWEMRFDEEAS